MLIEESIVYSMKMKILEEPKSQYVTENQNANGTLNEINTFPLIISIGYDDTYFFVTNYIGAFEYYMFHFAYYLVNSQKQKNDKVSYKIAMKCVYARIILLILKGSILIIHLNFFK